MQTELGRMAQVMQNPSGACTWWGSIVGCVKDNGCCSNPQLKTQIDNTNKQMSALTKSCSASCDGGGSTAKPGGSTAKPAPKPTPPPSPVKAFVFFVLKLAGLDKNSFTTAAQKAFKELIAKTVGKICGFDGVGVCTASDVAIKGFHAHTRRASTKVDFTLETYSQAKAKAGQTALKTEVAKPSFVSSLNTAMNTNITAIAVESSSTTPPPSPPSSGGTNVGLIVGLVIGIVVLLIIVGVVVWWFFLRTPAAPLSGQSDTKHVELQEGTATAAQVPNNKEYPKNP